MNRLKRIKVKEPPDKDRMIRDVVSSKSLLLWSLAFLAVAVCADGAYFWLAPRKNGHLHVPDIVYQAPFAMGIFVVAAIWNWRFVRRRLRDFYESRAKKGRF